MNDKDFKKAYDLMKKIGQLKIELNSLKSQKIVAFEKYRKLVGQEQEAQRKINEYTEECILYAD